MRLGEINIICTELEASKAFYCGLLGFEALEMEGDSALHCKLGNQPFLLLAVATEKAPDHSYESRAQISFDLSVPNLEAFAETLKQAGVSFAREYAEGCCFVRDPDGNVIELLDTNMG